MAKYDKPGVMVSKVMNPALGFLAEKLGISPQGMQVLAVRGRKTGEWHTTPVNPLPYQGGWYLLAPRGNTQWVRNLRVAGTGELRLGGKVRRFRAEELPDKEKLPYLREYLRRWYRDVAKEFGVSGPDASDAELERIAPDHPVFRITPDRG
jgi:deazaflavin-dependent oxidoreductase (nitroreductase family)